MGKSNKSPKDREFSLWCNEKNHKFNAETFARVSKKCASLVHANDYQGTINHPVTEETFNAFVLACQLKPFKVTITNAFELLELAQEWGIPSLETFVNRYISQKGLKRKVEDDYLGKLMTHLEDDNADVSNDIAGIARNFNEYLSDDRLVQVHPEHLFKILMQAENRRINPQLLIDFVMKLIENEPEKAVPLCLRIDFDRLTTEQNEEIFQCREIHEQAMGYFIAEALSALRNKATDDLTANEQRYIKEIQDIRDYLTKQRTVALAELQTQFESETKALEELIEKQQNQINELKQFRDNAREEAAQQQENFKKTYAKFSTESERIHGILKNIKRMEKERREKIHKLVNEKSIPIKQTVDEKCAEIISADKHKRDLMEKTVIERRDRLLQNHEEIKSMVNTFDLTIQHIHERINETRATVAAKIVTDHLRHDQFLRDVDRRFDVFAADDKIWNLEVDQVINAENIIRKLESKLRTTCPINVNHEIKTSTDAIERFASLFTRKKA
ncbi:hypothetical protein TRFO_02867 [Tritrichomonas foetus]|uniref:Uncharacterized protein n=1 Tax=Tritrichomonas foetus TaxID=1144522 RepID=A0A1J4L0N1_9EUKA|nr:hypothetical protein TRFO_02867 [Tritrichomonas foetus]|eukprot:OHT15534.1 hypothetical protein TRFO_02867 [Tritrichomonas foetus]